MFKMLDAGTLSLAAFVAHAAENDEHGWFENNVVETRFGKFEFKNGYLTEDSTKRLAELRTLNRAVEAYQRNLAAVSMAQFCKDKLLRPRLMRMPVSWASETA